MGPDRHGLLSVGRSIVSALALTVLVAANANANYVFVTKWGSEGTGDGEFRLPWGVAVDHAGNVHVTDSGNHRVLKFASRGRFLTKWGARGDGDGQFRNPDGDAVRPAVSDNKGDRP